MSKQIATVRLGPSDHHLAQGFLVEQWEITDEYGNKVNLGKVQVGSEDEYFIGELVGKHDNN